MPLDPVIQGFLDAAAANPRPPISEQTPAEARAGYALYASLAGEGPEMGSVRNDTLGGVPVRIYRPHAVAPDNAPVMMWIHGGGWMIGSLDTDDARCRTMAERAGVVVISVDYRLAPEHPFPAAFDDCLAVLDAVSSGASELGFDAMRIAVGGDSAGGNLSAALALWARNHGPRVAFQLLVYPAVAATGGSFASLTENGQGYFLTTESMKFFYDSYVPSTVDPNDPRVSPLHAESHAGLPSAHILTAEFDPLRDEGLAYVDALRSAGVAVTHTNWEGCIHGFFGMQALFPVAEGAMAEACAELRAALA